MGSKCFQSFRSRLFEIATRMCWEKTTVRLDSLQNRVGVTISMWFNIHNIAQIKLGLINSVVLLAFPKNISQQRRLIFWRSWNTHNLKRHKMSPVSLPPNIWASAMLLSVMYDSAVASNGIMFIPSFVKTGRLVQSLKWAHTHTDVVSLRFPQFVAKTIYYCTVTSKYVSVEWHYPFWTQTFVPSPCWQ
jgi:hypothetical protein